MALPLLRWVSSAVDRTDRNGVNGFCVEKDPESEIERKDKRRCSKHQLARLKEKGFLFLF